MEEIFIRIHTNADNFHWHGTSRSICALARVEVTFSWVNRIGWVYEVAGEIKVTWVGNEPHHVGYLLEIGNT
jgi:hypothetical protein